MLNAKKDIANTYVFTGVIPALTPVTLTVAGNSMIVRELPEKIVTKTAHTALTPAAAQARNSLIDPIAV
jgi:hypothetical protein